MQGLSRVNNLDSSCQNGRKMERAERRLRGRVKYLMCSRTSTPTRMARQLPGYRALLPTAGSVKPVLAVE